MSEEEKKKAAKDLVNLMHVETKKQQVDKEKLANAFVAKKGVDDLHKTTLKNDALTPDDQAILTSFEKKRMILERIWITTNQARSQTGLAPIKRDELKQKLTRLVDLGYLNYESVKYEKEANDVYVLTEKGQEIIQ